MKIPGKFPINTITKKLSSTEKKAVDDAINGSSTKNVVSVNTREILYKKSKKTFSVRLLNYVEPYIIKGQRYTLFYTEVDHNLNINDRVFITGGNYDSDLIIQSNKFNKLSDGYIVQYVDRTKFVLDIEYTGDLPWNDEPLDNYLKIYVANTQDEFNYHLQNISTKSFTYVTNKFAMGISGVTPYSNLNMLYANGTFSVSSANYGIRGITSSTDVGYTASNSFYILNATQSGYLEDMNYYVIDSQRKVRIGITNISGGSTTLTVYLRHAHNLDIGSTFTVTLSSLTGTNATTWNGTYTATIIDSYRFTVSKSGSISSFLTSGIAEGDFKVVGNGLLKIIGGDFTKDSISFKENYVYYYDTDNSTWKVERTHLKPIINEQNFRNGFFKKGEYNQGLLGTHQETINYAGDDVTFSLGTVLNVNWKSGNIGKGTGNDLSHFTSFDEFSLPSIKVNSKNNGGLGYNYIYDSYIKSSTIENGTFDNNLIGVDDSNVISDYLEQLTHTYSVFTKGGNYINSEIINSNLLSSDVFSSKIENSLLLNSKSVNSEFERTLFLKSKFNSEKIIKILNYDEKFINWYDNSSIKIFKLYKFYISQDSYDRLNNFQSFYLQGLKITKPNAGVLNLFDDKFSIDSYYASDDLYFSPNKLDKKVIVQLSTKEENEKIQNESSNLLISNLKSGYPSIDILMVATPSYLSEDFNTGFVQEEYGPYYFDITQMISSPAWGQPGTPSSISIYYNNNFSVVSNNFTKDVLLNDLNNLLIGSWTYSGNTFSVQSGYSFESMFYIDGFDESDVNVDSYRYTRTVISEQLNTLDISDAYIVDSDFKSGYFKDSTWISGNYINYNRDNSFVSNTNNYFGPININNGEMSVTLNTKNRKDLFKVNDTIFLNGFYYDTTYSGGDNLVKLPNTYKVSNYYDTSTRLLILVDAKNPTNSVLFNVTPATADPAITTKYALNSFNYTHPVKFENSKINSGLFRRAFFENCTIENNLFNNLDKDPVNFNNWRSLLLSDILFADNGNKIKNGLVINSSFVSGSDSWENGIFYNSIWNVQSFTYSDSATGSNIYTTSINKFKNGVFKESTWVDGIFENGIFYKNKSNTPFTPSVYSNNTPAYYRYGNRTTRYSWENGIFENGIFELSNFENGTFSNGDFYNSTFFRGSAINGNFGKRNLKYQLTRVASGSFSNINVISAEFRAENPTGQMDSNYQIDWYNGVFNNGVFGVKMDLGSYSNLGPNYIYNSTWYNGTFNNGYFSDIAVWKDGTFNNGRFNSFYGYPWVTSASYSYSPSTDFAWQDGRFNGGEFGNAQLGTNSTWFDGEFNGGIFRGRYWNNGVFTKGYFMGSGTSSTKLSNIPKYVSDFSESFYGLWNDGIVQEVKTINNPQKRFFTKLEREFTKKVNRTSAEFKDILWRGGTFSHNSGLFNNSVWTGGAFYKGKFYKSSFNPYLNYVVNGNFQDVNQDSPNDVKYWTIKSTDYVDDYPSYASILSIPTQLYSSDPGVKIQYGGTSSIINLSQTAGLIIGDTYTLKIIIDNNYNNELRFGNSNLSLRNRNFTEGNSYWIIASTSSGTTPDITIATGSPGNAYYNPTQNDSDGYLIYPNILEVGQTYFFKFYTYNETNFTYPYIGSCDSSQVSISDGVLLTEFVEGLNLTYSVPDGSGGTYFLTFQAEYPDFVFNFKTDPSLTSYRISGLVLTGNTNVLTSTNATSRTSISYTFNAVNTDFAIEFIPDATRQASTPPIFLSATSSILSIEVIKGTQSAFNTSDNCFWDNGTFEDSEFYISKWNNGKWISGTAVGMIWKNGIANYMNAYNVYWEGGVWKNGNWNGAPFNYENVNPNGCSYSYLPSPGFVTNNATWDNVDLSNYNGYSRVHITPQTNGAYLYFTDEIGFTTTYQDPELDPNNTSGLVYNNGFIFFNDNTSTAFALGSKYKVTISVGTVSIANLTDTNTVGIQFSIGKPSSIGSGYGGSSGLYMGSLYPSASSIASGEDFISFFYLIKDLPGNNGQVVPDLLISGVDGYFASTGGVITETVTARDNGRLYVHINAYGVNEMYIDNISIELENCIPAIEVNDGYASDILTNVSLYRESKGDVSYKDIFINDAFTVSVDENWTPVPNDISISMTQSSTLYPSAKKWNYYAAYSTRTLTTMCTTGKGSSAYGYYAWSLPPNIFTDPINYIQFILSLFVVKPNYATNAGTSNFLYAVDENNSTYIFHELGTYDIQMKYVMQYGPTFSFTNPNNVQASMQIEVGYSQGSNNGGIKEIVTKNIRVYPIGCGGSEYFGTTPELIWSTTFEPTAIGFTYSQLDQFKIKKIQTTNGTRLIITELNIVKKVSKYDPVYNNATYSIMQESPSYNDTLLLPNINMIGGQSNGNIISTRFGNGIFTSGTASSFSSIWENGVWNEGLRYDRNVYLFDNLALFPNTLKPYSFSGEISTKNSKIGVVPSKLDRNISEIKKSNKNWIIVLRQSRNYIVFDNGEFLNQVDFNASYYFKIGDYVNVGNLVCIDINGNRRLIKDYLKVVDIDVDKINGDSLYLQLIVNFPIRGIQRDSSEHLIYVSKNVWLSGVFLNGLFKGIWSNGLFKGRPYITKMVDSQWVDGRFDGGHFRGLTFSIYDTNPMTEEITSETEISFSHAGLIQNFNFKSNNILLPYEFIYDSWIDVNYDRDAAVSINKDILLQKSINSNNRAGSYKFTDNNFYGYPTKDILSSISSFRNGSDTNIKDYRLGWNYERYEQFLPYDGNFKKPFDNLTNSPGISEFTKVLGWTWSFLNEIYTQGNSQYDGELLYRFKSNIQDENSRGGLHIALNNVDHVSENWGAEDGTGFRIDNYLTELDIANNGNKYTMIEFEIDYVGPTYSSIYFYDSPPFSLYPPGTAFGGIQTYNLLDPVYYNGITYSYKFNQLVEGAFGSSYIANESYPINHLATSATVKREYFYNRAEISFYFNTTVGDENDDGTTATIDRQYFFRNIKYTEIDMIPFFMYATESRINQKILAPYYATAPFIDYSQNDYSLIDNIIISETLFETTNNPVVTINSGGAAETGGFTFDAKAAITGGKVMSSLNSFGSPVSRIPSGTTLIKIPLSTTTKTKTKGG